MIIGYKCFNKGLTSRYGDKYEIGRVYHKDGIIAFSHNGFHMCLNLEDTLRYFDSFKEDIEIAQVVGSGMIHEYRDDYNAFYNVYVTEYLNIIHVLTREEIISYALNLDDFPLKRFISLYKLNKDEIELFKEKYKDNDYIISAINYYQENDLEIYKRKVLMRG